MYTVIKLVISPYRLFIFKDVVKLLLITITCNWEWNMNYIKNATEMMILASNTFKNR